MKRSVHVALIFIVLVPIIAMLPMFRIVSDWVRVSMMVSTEAVQASVHGYDWVSWQDDDGLIKAVHVFPRGPAWEAGIRKGDVFFELNYQQYFNAADLRHAIEGIEPGSINTYSVLRDGEIIEMSVPFTRYPTFLYPSSTTLRQFAIWGFTVGAFLHILGLIIAGPLAVRSRKAWQSLLLILVSSLWMFANVLRLLMVELLGPPLRVGGITDTVWQALTLVGLFGWIGFPALLLEKVLRDAALIPPRRSNLIRALLYAPAAVLLAIAALTTLYGNLGPFTQAGLIGPILFHTCWYIAAAAAAVLAHQLFRWGDDVEELSGWSKAGSGITLILSSIAALSAVGILPILGAATDLGAWLIVCTQLLSVAPVLLVTVATLKHGKVDLVVSRGLTYLTVLGLIFFAFVGGMSIMEPYIVYTGAAYNVIAGLYVIMLLIVFERLARLVRVYAANFFSTERQRARQTLSRFQEQMRAIASPTILMHQTVQVVGQSFDVKSAVVFLQVNGPSGTWLSSSFHPEPPYFTERVLELFWPHFEHEGRIWARNQEINESTLPKELAKHLEERGAALAIPIMGELAPVGLMVLSHKKPKRAVYNLEDLDLLRALGGHLALSIERLTLIERERALERESAEAQLVALRAQINPHFLFNALNTIVSLIEERPDEAEETVENLAAIFRHILQTNSLPFVTLEEELALVSHYLNIEKARFGSNLSLEMSVSPDLRELPVPAFAIQTLVENAVKHGLEKRRGGGEIRVAAHPSAGGTAEIIVEDTGVGIPALFGNSDSIRSDTSFYGIGLRNVSGRLEKLYGRRDLLHLSSAPDRGTRAVMRLPANFPEEGSPQPATVDLPMPELFPGDDLQQRLAPA